MEKYEKNYKCREVRTCEYCGCKFYFRTCYAKRPGTPGRFCSRPCRSSSLYGKGNPNITTLACQVGTKEAKKINRSIKSVQLRMSALVLLNPALVCENCGCDTLEFLQVNHRNGITRERRQHEMGVRLWKIVIGLGADSVKYFNVLCGLCNWLEFYTRRGYAGNHRVVWRCNNE